MARRGDLLSALFYAEDMGISLCKAERIQWFIDLFGQHSAVMQPRPWAKNGIVRVYFDFWSQNSLNPVESIDKSYYCIGCDDVFVVQHRYGSENRTPLSVVADWGRSNFSGAKTRQAIKDFGRVFYEQKANRNKCS